MRAIAFVVVLLGACEPTPHEAMVRWPKHRDLEEKRISELEAEVQVLRARIDQLERGQVTPPPATTAP